MTRPSGGIDPAGDVTTGASLGDVHTPDPARAGHEALGCWRYPHEGACEAERVVSVEKWIRFVDEGATPSGKTRVFRVEATANHVEGEDGDVILGTVKWFSRWRRYAFFPSAETVFEPTCLHDIANFCVDQSAAKRMRGTPAED